MFKLQACLPAPGPAVHADPEISFVNSGAWRAVKLLILFCAFALALPADRAYGAAPQTLKLPGFQITVPPGWRAIPPQEINRLNERARGSSPSGNPQNFEYGFQPEDRDRWFAFPYVLIRRNTSGRWGEKEIANVDKDFAEATQKYLTKMSDRISDAASAKGDYDPASNIVWSRFDVTLTGVGPVAGLSAIKLTSNGYLQVTGYDRAADFENSAGTFREIAESLALDPTLSYSPATASAPAPEQAWSFGVEQLLAVLAMLALGLLIFRAVRQS